MPRLPRLWQRANFSHRFRDSNEGGHRGTLTGGVRSIEWAVPSKAEMVGAVTVVEPDRVGVASQEIKVFGIVRYIVKFGEVPNEHSFKLRDIAAMTIAKIRMVP